MVHQFKNNVLLADIRIPRIDPVTHTLLQHCPDFTDIRNKKGGKNIVARWRGLLTKEHEASASHDLC